MLQGSPLLKIMLCRCGFDAPVLS